MKYLRPCYVKFKNEKKKALFHKWGTIAAVRDEILIGQTSGQIINEFAIVEFENGKVEFVMPYNITFCDSNALFNEYCFE